MVQEREMRQTCIRPLELLTFSFWALVALSVAVLWLDAFTGCFAPAAQLLRHFCFLVVSWIDTVLLQWSNEILPKVSTFSILCCFCHQRLNEKLAFRDQHFAHQERAPWQRGRQDRPTLHSTASGKARRKESRYRTYPIAAPVDARADSAWDPQVPRMAWGMDGPTIPAAQLHVNQNIYDIYKASPVEMSKSQPHKALQYSTCQQERDV